MRLGAGTLLLASGPPQLVRAQTALMVGETVREDASGERLPGATVRVGERPDVGTGVAASGPK